MALIFPDLVVLGTEKLSKIDVVAGGNTIAAARATEREGFGLN
jgi:hypothetical protein